ncbi:MAG: DUF488 domain-containing protein [Gemmatimonadetes bacterium]|uniref:DUF488 domain-containing protein n=1 Tax=Candidatus Kutchimonas denitrificans TaxID=3056748 RepID=A0AAE4Z8U4_9BACT|nr:DUF488 domain-containing protein [Gemmatimonadota bacterium]NIR75788.1 DUF488 domain-containing protein [Candidatus Kutchimonas denitrificans]NIS01956.1 DUF488 domain-containing protein [Gemmatimonadota bacterium]NIT67760.1 DUF488 domain-containing protein [Gemmatimonadota bacterium]NIU53747.1 DUF488 family protein [Gemmatimonadota bacterium]
MSSANPVFTIGHSTRSTDELIALLNEHGVARLLDVRRFPGSRRHPHFSREALAASLGAVGIEYAHEPGLGGRRKGRSDSPHTAWRVAGFRAYADHMESDEFRAAFSRLVDRAEAKRTAIMCAEATPWRCHRQLIADALTARGHEVLHILGPGRTQPHALNPAARLLPDGRLLYPADGDEQMKLFDPDEPSPTD